jgi:hypothetical protein
MDIIPQFEGRPHSDLPTVTITLLDSVDGPKTIRIWGATDIKMYGKPTQCENGREVASVHVRLREGEWSVATPQGQGSRILSEQ